MEKKPQLLAEYQLLRDEIKQANNINNQTLAIIIGIVGVVMTAGIAQTDPFARMLVFLVVYTITIPGYRFLHGNRRHIWRVSTYIRVFLEVDLEGIEWETRLELQGKLKSESQNSKFRRSSLVTTNEWMILFLFNMVTFFAVILIGFNIDQLPIGPKVIGAIIFVIFNLVLFSITYFQEKILRRGGKVEQDYYHSWEDVKKAQLIKIANNDSKQTDEVETHSPTTEMNLPEKELVSLTNK